MLELGYRWEKEVREERPRRNPFSNDIVTLGITTYRIFHAFGYTYVLNVVLIEGNKITDIRNDIFSPKRKFALSEGGIFFHDH